MKDKSIINEVALNMKIPERTSRDNIIQIEGEKDILHDDFLEGRKVKYKIVFDDGVFEFLGQVISEEIIVGLKHKPRFTYKYTIKIISCVSYKPLNIEGLQKNQSLRK